MVGQLRAQPMPRAAKKNKVSTETKTRKKEDSFNLIHKGTRSNIGKV